MDNHNQSYLNKKMEECDFLKRFNAIINRFNLHGKLCDKNGESPDFVIPDGPIKTGIEITKVMNIDSHGNTMSPKHQSLLNSIRRKVSDSLNAIGFPPSCVTLGLLDENSRKFSASSNNIEALQFDLRREKFDATVDYILEKIISLQKNGSNYDRWDNARSNSQHPIIGYIEYRTWHGKRHIEVILGPSAMWITLDGRREIQSALTSKEDLIEKYRDRCDRLCLLLVLQNADLATAIEIDTPIMDHVFETSADEAYVLQLAMHDRAYKLHINKPHK